jgi:hypothetical protein
MATQTQEQLATRILRKIKVCAPQDAADADDLAVALEKLQAAHFTMRAQGLVRWTLADIPPEVQEAYVLCGASLAAEDYGAPVAPDLWLRGLRMVQAFVHVPITGASYVENF